jgi:oligopeptide/dipeptide ABC transporter ATP-binding protein
MSPADSTPLLQVEGLRKYFQLQHGLFQRDTGQVKAIDDVSFTLNRGEVLGLVGESGSGKTTTGRLVLRLVEPTSGTIQFDGTDITALNHKALRATRRRMQIVFQDPFSSLNPYMRVGEIIEEPLVIHSLESNKAARRERVGELLEMVGLRPAHAGRYPHEFSGGQRQRIGIARALAAGPDFIVADEAVSALDVSIQAQVVNLLKDLQVSLNLAMLFITHDLAVVRYIADRMMVMYLGRIVEMGPTDMLFSAPQHPYTEALLSAIPNPDPDARRSRVVLKGEIASTLDVSTGCAFRGRCRYALPACAAETPSLRPVGEGRFKACIRDDIL